VQEMLWSNPRVVFFREEPLSDLDAGFGPRGAQGVTLTPGRSIAVDKENIPYGTPVWLSTPGPVLALNRLVFAQDTGSAIVGAVRADYFVGWGSDAGEIAGRVKQPLALWALWPR
jgi:membrane-bound lytic murein transglycosylase A